MSSRPAVVRNPARREECLALVRAQPRISKTAIADAMRISLSCARDLIVALEADGLVATEVDRQAPRSRPKSGPPLVVWIPGSARPARSGGRPTPRTPGFKVVALPESGVFYQHTGTAVGVAGAIQLLCVTGRAG